MLLTSYILSSFSLVRLELLRHKKNFGMIFICQFFGMQYQCDIVNKQLSTNLFNLILFSLLQTNNITVKLNIHLFLSFKWKEKSLSKLRCQYQVQFLASIVFYR